MFLDIFKYLLSSIFKSLEFFSIWYMIFPGNIFLMGIYIYMHSLNYSESINMYIHTHSGCSILTLFLMTFQLIFLSFADTYLIWTSHLKGLMQEVVFCDWILPFSRVFPRSIHMAACTIPPSFLWLMFHCAAVPPVQTFTHWWTFRCLLLLGHYKNTVTMQIHVQIFVWAFFSSPGEISKNRIAGSYTSSVLKLLRPYQTVSKVLHHFTFPPAV